jgi:hypothetical protein
MVKRVDVGERRSWNGEKREEVGEGGKEVKDGETMLLGEYDMMEHIYQLVYVINMTLWNIYTI